VYDTEGKGELIRKRPHEYLDQFWISANVSAERETLPYVVKRYGPNRLMMAVDFPHGLGGSGETAIEQVLTNPGLTQAEKERILGLNAAELFGIATDSNGDPLPEARTKPCLLEGGR
jgi:predicted TIM-barrel fold metal-dependent hydrolase